ncbi:Undecaprenyl-phosphate 4-deoxy-4-formamido-L-arabinose transferase [Burkholderiales bacterium]|nr:Undecaprenyl-phosphate 4-deoxy-4-formamido-L-arabinose transferase [Burkholderiales bacterium]
MPGSRVSIVVPALDEAPRIAAALDALAPLRAQGHQVVVVDGGSGDATVPLAMPRADRVLTAPRGRASQMNAGAAVATGDVLLFLHADSRLPPDAIEAISRANRAGRRWGRFDVTIDGRSPLLPVVAMAMNWRSRLTGIATGDQGMFVERALFASVGGFPRIPLMEDVELSRTLKRRAGRPACIASRIRTSGRRWDDGGAWPTIALMWRLRAAHALGADPARLAQAYRMPPGRRRRILQVFARAPEPGKVKTRLARSLGDEPAADAYRDLALHALSVAKQARERGVVASIELWCTPDIAHPSLVQWARDAGATLHGQHGNDLGARMRHALGCALARGDVPILIGTDCPAIDADYLASASEALDECDAVIGPVEDGGYALVGLARDVDAFAGIAWSTPAVMSATRAALARAGASWAELPLLWDVDTADDLARWRDPPAGRA